MEKIKYLVDTDILVDFLRGHPQAVRFVSDQQKSIAFSVITVAELYAGVKDDKENEQLNVFLSIFSQLPVTPEIATLGGNYRRFFRKSHGIGLADAIIAATADTYRLALKTLNLKHYPMFKNLQAPYAK